MNFPLRKRDECTHNIIHALGTNTAMHILVTVQLVSNGSAKRGKRFNKYSKSCFISLQWSTNCICNTNVWLSGYDLHLFHFTILPYRRKVLAILWVRIHLIIIRIRCRNRSHRPMLPNHNTGTLPVLYCRWLTLRCHPIQIPYYTVNTSHSRKRK